MKQLHLSAKQLKAIGFTRKNKGRQYRYEIPITNGCFYFNPKGLETHKWYLQIKVDGYYNHTSLDITNAATLFVVMSALKLRYNFFII